MSTPKGMKLVNTRQREYPYENGDKYPSRPVNLYLDTRGDAEFCFILPDYVVQQLGRSPEVRGVTAASAEAAWSKVCAAWQEHVRTARATPVIILEVSGQYQDADGNRARFGHEPFFWDHSITDLEEPKVGISVAYELAFKVNGQVHNRDRDHRVDDENDPKAYKVGSRMVHPPELVLDYTPELHARIDEIRATISRAGAAMEEILKAKDITTALIKSRSFRALPAPTETT